MMLRVITISCVIVLNLCCLSLFQHSLSYASCNQHCCRYRHCAGIVVIFRRFAYTILSSVSSLTLDIYHCVDAYCCLACSSSRSIWHFVSSMLSSMSSFLPDLCHLSIQSGDYHYRTSIYWTICVNHEIIYWSSHFCIFVSFFLYSMFVIYFAVLSVFVLRLFPEASGNSR